MIFLGWRLEDRSSLVPGISAYRVAWKAFPERCFAGRNILRQCRRRRQAEYHCGDPEFIRHYFLEGTRRAPVQTGAAHACD